MAFEEIVCAECGYDANISSPESCGDQCGDTCEKCEIIPCGLAWCPGSTLEYLETPCVAGVAGSGQVVDITLSKPANTLFALKDSISSNSTRSYDQEAKECTTDETVIYRIKKGVDEFNATEKMVGSLIVNAFVDNCDIIRIYGLDGNSYVTNVTEVLQDGECYNEITINNKKSRRVTFDWEAAGYASADDALADLSQ